jgi:hypothetical protein
MCTGRSGEIGEESRGLTHGADVREGTDGVARPLCEFRVNGRRVGLTGPAR